MPRDEEGAGAAAGTGDPAGEGRGGERAGVAGFDVDGTLLATDSFLPFLMRVAGGRRFWRTTLTSAPAIVGAYGGGRDRDATKEILVERLLRDISADDLADAGAAYGAELAGRVRPAMRRRLAWHREQGHRVVLVSASLDVYLVPFGQHIGVDAVLATSLDVDAGGRLTGRLLGANCRGPEKAARLRTWLDAHLPGADVELWAYGDSVGDRELLAMAHHAHLVDRRSPYVR